LFIVTALLICAEASLAADLHPIVEVQSGYLFGAISDGKWIKADETAKLMEIVVGSNYYEGEDITIYRCDPKKVEGVTFCGLRRLTSIIFPQIFCL
jgi:hypothetical protein